MSPEKLQTNKRIEGVLFSKDTNRKRQKSAEKEERHFVKDLLKNTTQCK